MYRSLARWCYHRRWFVVALWLVAIVGINVAGGIAGSQHNAEFGGLDSESDRGFTILEEHFPGAGSAFGGQIVFQTEAGVDSVQPEMEAMFAEVATIDGVTLVDPYTPFGAEQVNEDRTIAFAQINLRDDINESEATLIGQEIDELIPQVDGLRVELGGAALGEFEPPETELIGLAFAIVVLILAFGSVLAMGLPITIAIAGVAAGGFGLVTLLTHVFQIPEFAPLVGVMIGIGVGIDYALFIVTRYRELTRLGASSEQATVGAMDTAGRAVVFAGITVVVSLLGMLLIGLPFIAGLGIAAAATVAATLIASVTLLPALLAIAHGQLEITRWRGLIGAGFVALGLLGAGFGQPLLVLAGLALAIVTMVLGTKIGSRAAIPQLHRVVPPRREKPIRDTIAHRWSRLVQARPWTGVFVGAGLLVIMSIPVFGLRLGFSDEGNFPEDTTTRQAYDLISEGFGPGYNGPFLLAAELDDPAQLEAFAAAGAAIAADPGVQSVTPPFPSNGQDPSQPLEAAVMRIVPTTSPQAEETDATVKRLRADVIPDALAGSGVDAHLTGAVPANIDFSDYLAGRILVFFGAVLTVSFLLLMMVFRSVLVPLKAVVMNVLSIAAAYGVVVALFQWGWLGGITGIEPAPIEPFVPMMLFAIVFGLSMDYEVFLLSRVKEEYDRTGDPVHSVADGLAATARVITAAAAIMVVVFGAFLLEDNRIIKLFGTGLGLAVLLDATLVRMLLVPATMELLGSKNWWLPKWLDRLLPTLHVEGESVDELIEEFAPGTRRHVDDDWDIGELSPAEATAGD